MSEMNKKIKSILTDISDLASDIENKVYKAENIVSSKEFKIEEDEAIYIEIDRDKTLTDSMKQDFLSENWDKITLEQLESLM